MISISQKLISQKNSQISRLCSTGRDENLVFRRYSLKISKAKKFKVLSTSSQGFLKLATLEFRKMFLQHTIHNKI